MSKWSEYVEYKSVELFNILTSYWANDVQREGFSPRIGTPVAQVNVSESFGNFSIFTCFICRFSFIKAADISKLD